MNRKANIIIGSMTLLAFMGVTQAYGEQLNSTSSKDEISNWKISQQSACYLQPSTGEAIDLSSLCATEETMESDSVLREESEVTEEINEINRLGGHTVRTGPVSFVVFSEERELTASEQESIKRAEDFSRENPSLFPSGETVSTLLNDPKLTPSKVQSFSWP